MSNDRGSQRILSEFLEGMPKVVNLTVAAPTYQMKPGDTCISVISAAADAAGIVTLPSLAEAAGKFYFIEAPTGASGGDISLYEKETGAEYVGGGDDGDLDADNDYVILYCSGRGWKTVKDGVA